MSSCDSCKDGWLLKPSYDGNPTITDIPCFTCRPGDHKTWSDIKDIERKLSEVEWAIAGLKSDLEKSKFKNRFKKFIKETDWTLRGPRRKIVEKTFLFRVRQRRHFYRYRILSSDWESKMVPPCNSLMRVIYVMQPTWIGRKILGYPEWKEGYYGKPGEWKRMVSQNQSEISHRVKKELDAIYDHKRLRELVRGK